MKISSTGRVYTPKFCGNRELPVEVQVRVHCGYLTYGDALAMRGGVKDEVEFGEKVLRKKIHKIENLEIDGRNITNGSELFDCDNIPYDLATELGEAVMNYSKLTEDEVKNSSNPLPSDLKATEPLIDTTATVA